MAQAINAHIKTRYTPQLDWPETYRYSAGGSGVVFKGDGKHYKTAFFELYTDGVRSTFMRGEGETMQEAEQKVWDYHEKMKACKTYPMHGPFEARSYTNGAGYCQNCGVWFSKVLPAKVEDKNKKPTQLELAFLGDEVAIKKVLSAVADAPTGENEIEELIYKMYTDYKKPQD